MIYQARQLIGLARVGITRIDAFLERQADRLSHLEMALADAKKAKPAMATVQAEPEKPGPYLVDDDYETTELGVEKL